jgi:glycosyltransferase involved in cell wall biosynthesis
MADAATRTLNILHVMRAPVGGLFRHVVDLARGQAARGHRIGLIADARTGGTRAEAILAELAPALAFGITRVPMSRQIGASDATATSHVSRRAGEVGADVVHGHGAKGGAYARLARARNAIRVYTPHGGSLHYRWTTPSGLLYLGLERALMARTDLFLFESAYGRDVFAAKIGMPRALTRVVHNGVTAGEFEAVAPAPDAADLVFVGELRILKGVDVLIKAIAKLAGGGRAVTATIIGEGPDRAAFEAEVAAHNLAPSIRFRGAMPARTAFSLGRVLVVPSRAESLPYIVLEAAAAGMPLIATRVGGIPEIFGPDAGDLVAPADVAALAETVGAALIDPAARRHAAARLQARIRGAFSADAMTEGALAAYGRALELRDG